MEEGAISAEMLGKAFESATTGTGKFAGMQDRLANTFAGSKARLIDQLKLIGVEYGGLVNQLAQPVFIGLSEGIDKLILEGNSSALSQDFAQPIAKKTEVTWDKIAEQLKGANKEQEKLMQRLSQDGDQLTRSLRTPMEILKDDLAEFTRLMDSNVISSQTFARASERSAKAFRDAAMSANRIKEMSTPSVSAASGTAGVSAIFRARIDEQDRAASERAAAARHAEIAKILRDVHKTLKQDNRPEIVLNEKGL
jgi:hypothetical protein